MIYAFEDYELDTLGYELRCEGEPCPVEPQVFDVLAYLVRHRERVVTKQELLDGVWGHRFVGESTMSTRIMEARKAVGDDGRAQRVIRTIHGRGFRFALEVEERDHTTILEAPSGPVTAAPPEPAREAIGRDTELATLEGLLAGALAGERRIGFVTGDAGLGKTTLVEAFLARAREREPGIGIARGQCLEHVGAGEPFGPVLEALGRLCRELDGDEMVALLDRRAPSWLVQMPSLVDTERLEALRRRTVGTRGMARELVEALEEWTALRPLVLVLEDLHWSDPSTVDLIGWLARREEPARLLLIATSRPGDARAAGHPVESLRRDLVIRSLCEAVALEPLDEVAVGAILAERMPGTESVPGLVGLVHERSGGNPLFVDGLLDAWVSAGAISRSDGRWSLAASLEELGSEVPETLRLLIEDRLDRLEPIDREILSAASVAGPEFASATVAAALERDAEEIELRLDALTRQRRFVVPREPVEWPDGTVSARFGFDHHLYPRILYDRTPSGRRARLHMRIGNRLEAGYGHLAVERTPELVVHFARGGDPVRAVRYRRLAAERAMRRGAPREAAGHLTAGLELIRSRDNLPGRERLEHGFLAMLGSAILLIEGWAAPEAERAFARACEIGERLGEKTLLLPALYGLAVVLEYRARYGESQAIMEEVLEIGPPNDEFRLQAHELLACSLFHQGAFAETVEQADRGLAAIDPERPALGNAEFGDDSAMSCHAWAGLASWFLGHPDEALERAEIALRLARDPDRRYCLANALSQAARIHQLRRDVTRTRATAAEAKELAERQGFAYFGAVATILHGWARAMEGDAGGVAEIERGVLAHEATGATMDRPYFLGLLAEALAETGRPAEGLEVVRAARTAIGADRPFFGEPELIRLEGQLVLEADPADGSGAAEERYRRSIDRARELGARASELRAATGLARLWGEDRADDRRALLEPLVASMDGAPDDPDLAEAVALLA